MNIDPAFEHRRRATSEDVVLRRSAMAVVRALHPEITRVQKRAAFLVSISERNTDALADHIVLDAEAVALQTAIQAYTEQLAEQLDGLPPALRNHGRILDTVRALQSVHTILEQARLGFSERGTSNPRPMPAVDGFRLPATSTGGAVKLPITQR